MMMSTRTRTRCAALTLTGLAALALASCGGGDDGATGTLRLSLTDAPACGFETAFVTVEKVRVHKSSTAGDSDGEWQEIVLASPQRIDLLSLTNGALHQLGEKRLPAGTYTQLRLVLAPNTPSDPMANAVTPVGGVETALTTPSGQQSGLKLNVNLEVPADRVADFAIDFDGCKSFVRAGNSGKILLKPVLAVIPILADAGQRIEGYLDASLVVPGTTVSAQTGGSPVRATPPGADGKFSLYPVPPGTYDLVITAAGRVNAVVTGVPVVTTAITTLGTPTGRIDTPASAASHAATGKVTRNGSVADTGGVVRAMQSFTGGPSVEVGSANALADSGTYSLTLPAGAPVRLPYAAGLSTFAWVADPLRAGLYRLEATATDVTTPKSADITLTGPVTQDFVFP